MPDSNQHSGLVEAITLGIECYRRPGVGRDIDVYAHALLSLERLVEQLEASETMGQENYDAACLRADEAEEELATRTTLYDQLVREHARLREQLETLRGAVEEFVGAYPEHPGHNYSDADTEFVRLGEIRALRAALNPAESPDD